MINGYIGGEGNVDQMPINQAMVRCPVKTAHIHPNMCARMRGPLCHVGCAAMEQADKLLKTVLAPPPELAPEDLADLPQVFRPPGCDCPIPDLQPDGTCRLCSPGVCRVCVTPTPLKRKAVPSSFICRACRAKGCPVCGSKDYEETRMGVCAACYGRYKAAIRRIGGNPADIKTVFMAERTREFMLKASVFVHRDRTGYSNGKKKLDL